MIIRLLIARFGIVGIISALTVVAARFASILLVGLIIGIRLSIALILAGLLICSFVLVRPICSLILLIRGLRLRLLLVFRRLRSF